MAVPSRVPPLGVNRVLTPELRSITSPDIAQPILPVAADVVDLGTYENSSYSVYLHVLVLDLERLSISPRLVLYHTAIGILSNDDGKLAKIRV